MDYSPASTPSLSTAPLIWCWDYTCSPFFTWHFTSLPSRNKVLNITVTDQKTSSRE